MGTGSRLITLIALLLSFLFPVHPVQAATQKVNFYINGDCLDYYDMEDEYAFFEEEPNWTCYIEVKISPYKPVRLTRLQYWNGKKWIQESTKKTSSKGIAYLYFNPYCDGKYCDGEWKYRIFVDSVSGNPSKISPTFSVAFYPGNRADYEECDPDFEECSSP